jgi:hypothetical protein
MEDTTRKTLKEEEERGCYEQASKRAFVNTSNIFWDMCSPLKVN